MSLRYPGLRKRSQVDASIFCVRLNGTRNRIIIKQAKIAAFSTNADKSTQVVRHNCKFKNLMFCQFRFGIGFEKLYSCNFSSYKMEKLQEVQVHQIAFC